MRRDDPHARPRQCAERRAVHVGRDNNDGCFVAYDSCLVYGQADEIGHRHPFIMVAHWRTIAAATANYRLIARRTTTGSAKTFATRSASGRTT